MYQKVAGKTRAFFLIFGAGKKVRGTPFHPERKVKHFTFYRPKRRSPHFVITKKKKVSGKKRKVGFLFDTVHGVDRRGE